MMGWRAAWPALCGVLALAAGLIAVALPALAQWRATKPITFIVMAGKGGGADNAARFLADLIQKNGLTPVPIEILNIPGNSGGDALVELQRRRGDDHTILFTLNSFYTTPIDKPQLNIDVAAFTPLARLAEDVFLLWVHADQTDIKSIDDFVRAAREKGKGWVMAGTGTGAEDNLLTDFLNATFGLEMTYKSFAGGGEVAQQLADKLADSTVNNPSETAKLLAAGKVKPIVAITPKRLGGFITVPTLRETGMDFHYFMQRSVVGTPQMSGPAVAFYQELFQKLFEGADWQAYRAKNSLAGELLSGEQLKAYWVKEREKHIRWKMAIEVMTPAP
ncbi:MAG: tripartite tricarboxylate transporter substrate-binding protein [Hyphomicrobiaceae bacterium]|nr:tripartite tricarboxylate transporter substrate-binding protein [Hyphomicrobiaceae bacterium]